jgi:hypothetical protein
LGGDLHQLASLLPPIVVSKLVEKQHLLRATPQEPDAPAT